MAHEKGPRVFAVQVPARRDGPRGGWIDKFDLSAAEQFGKLVRVLGPGNVPRDPEPTRQRLDEALADYRFDVDFVLLLGDPVAIAQAVSVLAQKRAGPIRCLKWDRFAGEYEVYEVG